MARLENGAGVSYKTGRWIAFAAGRNIDMDVTIDGSQTTNKDFVAARCHFCVKGDWSFISRNKDSASGEVEVSKADCSLKLQRRESGICRKHLQWKSWHVIKMVFMTINIYL